MRLNKIKLSWDLLKEKEKLKINSLFTKGQVVKEVYRFHTIGEYYTNRKKTFFEIIFTNILGEEHKVITPSHIGGRTGQQKWLTK